MMISDKPRLESSRAVRSLYLSPVSGGEPPPPLPPSPSHNHPLSPNRQQKQPKSSSKHTGLLRGVWPSSHPSKSHNHNSPTTLAEYLGNDRKRDSVSSTHLIKQKSCSEFNRFENNPKKQSNLKENQKPLFGGGSMRYTGKFRCPGRSSTSSTTKSSEFVDPGAVIMPGRLSVDENELRRRSYSARMRSDSFSEVDSECSDMGSPFVTGSRNSPASYMAPTLSSRKSSKSILSTANSPTKSTIKNAMKKTNSLALPSKWGRSESPPTPTNSSFSGSKPPTSPSRTAKKNYLHMGLDLIKLKRSNRSGCFSPLGADMGMAEGVHQLRMMHGSWMQWRYANARANAVNETLDNKAKKDSLHALENITKLQQSVLYQRLRLEKEKLELKLNFLVHSQMKMLEAWRDMERKHTSDVSVVKDCFEAVACRVPLIEGAKMDSQTSSIALRHAADLVTSIMSSIMPTTHETVSTFSELAKIAMEEKLLLEECVEHFRVISTLEIQERSLKCGIIEMISSEDQQ